jgi:hypothetical protein
MVLGSTQPRTEMGTRNLPAGVCCVRLTISTPSVSLDVSETYGTTRPVTGTVLNLLGSRTRQRKATGNRIKKPFRPSTRYKTEMTYEGDPERAE